jgi:hypothetical protein
MRRLLFNRSFLAAYSGVLTATLLVATLCGFVGSQSRSFDQITVHRINIIEPDGTVRMILSDKADAPGGYIKKKEYPHPDRKSAGLYFIDDEGTEDGGLIFGLNKDEKGARTGNYAHLSFDQYMQDQIFTVNAGKAGDKAYSYLTMQDQDNYPLLDAIARISQLPKDQQAAEFEKLKSTHPVHQRVLLGRAIDGGSELRLKDADGNDRIVLRVGPDGNPKVQLLDAKGNVTAELPGAADPAAHH